MRYSQTRRNFRDLAIGLASPLLIAFACAEPPKLEHASKSNAAASGDASAETVQEKEQTASSTNAEASTSSVPATTESTTSVPTTTTTTDTMSTPTTSTNTASTTTTPTTNPTNSTPVVTTPVVKGLANGAYRIINAKTSKCMDLTASNKASGTSIQSYDCNGGDAQVFLVEAISDGLYTIKPKLSGLSISVRGEDFNTGSVIEQSVYNIKVFQQFVVELDLGTTYYRIRTKGGVMSIMPPNESQTSGIPLEIWPSSSSKAQRWTFQAVP